MGGPRENVRNLAGRREGEKAEKRGALTCGEKGGTIFPKLCSENRVNSLVLHTNSHLSVGPNICSESRLACSI